MNAGCTFQGSVYVDIKYSEYCDSNTVGIVKLDQVIIKIQTVEGSWSTDSHFFILSSRLRLITVTGDFQILGDAKHLQGISTRYF